MNSVMQPTSSDELRHRIEVYEKRLKAEPQLDIPVTQYFCNGVYLREITIPAGTLLTGKIPTDERLNIVLSGKCEMVTNDGVKVIEGPCVFKSPPGTKRAGRVLEDCTWLTAHAYSGPWFDEETMCDMFYVDTYELLEQLTDPQADRDDFLEAIAEYGFSEELVREQSVNTEDVISIPTFDCVEIRESNIEGVGLFARVPFPNGATVMPARIADKRTQAGRYTNHARLPNATMKFHTNGNPYLVTIADVDVGEELTVDYREIMKLQGVEPCQA
jgi:hypothetical protein